MVLEDIINYLYCSATIEIIFFPRDGHSTIVQEILEQCNETPAAVVVSVGGGGLLCGILKGLQDHGQPSSLSYYILLLLCGYCI